MKGMPSEEHIRREAALEGEGYEKERAEYEAGAAKRKKRRHGGFAEGEKSHHRLDRPGRKDGGKWIQASGVDRPGHKGALHRALGVPEGEPIPAKKLGHALASDNPHMRHMAQFAKNVKR
jgi:hypothetical protein